VYPCRYTYRGMTLVSMTASSSHVQMARRRLKATVAFRNMIQVPGFRNLEVGAVARRTQQDMAGDGGAFGATHKPGKGRRRADANALKAFRYVRTRIGHEAAAEEIVLRRTFSCAFGERIPLN